VIGKRAYRLGCSKVIVYSALLVFVALLTAFLYGVFFTDKDMTVFSIVLGADSAVTGAAIGFYFWKAKAEKKLELFERMAAKWEDKYGIEAVASLAQTIFAE
jgi:membrane associated rhomboid family serine protease